MSIHDKVPIDIMDSKKLLSLLLSNSEPFMLPIKDTCQEQQYDFTVCIGKSNIASVTMTKEAYEEVFR